MVTTSAPDPFSWVELLKVLGGLLLVIALMVAALWALRRAQPGTAASTQHLRVLATLPLGPRERLLLIQVGGQQLLLGAGPQGVRTLHVLPEPLTFSTPEAAGFPEWLRKVMERRGSSP